MKTIAFWKYDLFPYLLYAEVVREAEDGRVVVAGYGGMRVKPVHLLPEKQGEKIAEQLKMLDAEYKASATALKVDYTKRVSSLFGE